MTGCAIMKCHNFDIKSILPLIQQILDKVGFCHFVQLFVKLNVALRDGDIAKVFIKNMFEQY